MTNRFILVLHINIMVKKTNFYKNRTFELLTFLEEYIIIRIKKWKKGKEEMRHEVTYCKVCGEVGHTSNCPNKFPIYLFGNVTPHIPKRKVRAKLKCALCRESFVDCEPMLYQYIHRDGKLVHILRIHLTCYQKELSIVADNVKQATFFARALAKDINRQKARDRYHKKVGKKSPSTSNTICSVTSVTLQDKEMQKLIPIM